MAFQDDKTLPFSYFKTSAEIIRLAVMLYVRNPPSLGNMEGLLHERGTDISHETVRFWWNRFVPMFAAEIWKRHVQQLRAHSKWQWHLDEVFVKINGETHSLLWAVDHEGEVLESYVTKRRDGKAALKSLRKTMKRFGQPLVIVTDLQRSYGAAMKVIGNAVRQETGRWLNHRAEDSQPLPGSGLIPNHERRPFRRPERAMSRFRQIQTHRNSPPLIRQFTTISTRNVTFTRAIISSSTAPPLSLGGANLARLNGQLCWPYGDEF